MTLGSGLEKSTVPARHCRVPKLAPSRPEGWGGDGSPPLVPPPQESGKRRYGNGCKAHPPRALRRELCPIPKPPAARGERGRPAAAKGNPERKQPFEGLILSIPTCLDSFLCLRQPCCGRAVLGLAPRNRLHPWVLPSRGLGRTDPRGHSWGGFLWGDSAWDAVFPLEVANELDPFPLQLFPSLVAPTNAPGCDWTALRLHSVTLTRTGARGCDAPGH